MADQGKNQVLKFVRVSNKARIPTRGTPRSAGYDLYSAVNITLVPKGKAIITTDLIISVPEGTYGRIAPRSGLAANHSINVGAGVIDEDFRGILKIILFNHSEIPFYIKEGDRVAQLICEKIVSPDLLEVTSLGGTERGKKGFGSSGLN